MADIYVVQGLGSCGKTSTIKEIFRILDTKYPNCIKEVYRPLNARAFWLNKQYSTALNIILNPQNPNDKKKDIKIEMQNVKGFSVGIASQGDPPYNRLEKSLDFFSKSGNNGNGCDIIFCAERNVTSIIVANWVTLHPQYKINGTITLQKVGRNKQQQAQYHKSQAQNLVNQAGL